MTNEENVKCLFPTSNTYADSAAETKHGGPHTLVGDAYPGSDSNLAGTPATNEYPALVPHPTIKNKMIPKWEERLILYRTMDKGKRYLMNHDFF